MTPQRQYHSSSPLRLRSSDGKDSSARSSARPPPASMPRLENNMGDKKALKRPQNVNVIEDDDEVMEDSKADEIVDKTPILTRSRMQPPRGSSASKATPHEVAPDNDSKTKATGKQPFSISLTEKEIEEDLIKLTGAKPRSPKKRPSEVQKELDNQFPGSHLNSTTRSS